MITFFLKFLILSNGRQPQLERVGENQCPNTLIAVLTTVVLLQVQSKAIRAFQKLRWVHPADMENWYSIK
jgi:branched-subunit amino acid transport protein AzlD